MSDPQTNLDIEDVLSSIRRLVSEHPPLETRRTGRPRLILTPDIRVDVNPPAPVPEPQPEPAADDRAGSAREAVVETAAAEPAREGGPLEPTLEERIAELEHAIAATAGVWEPDSGDDGFDTVEVDAVAALAAARNGGADAAGEDVVEHEPAAEAPAASVDAPLLDDDEAILDEEMLRDLVAEFVRQELQGALGERITRNVRKLVRAEIQRALAAREFD